MPLLKDSYKKEEKIDGVIFDMSPSPNYRHGIVDGNIHAIIKQGLKGSFCLSFMENLDYKYHSEVNDDYVIPDVMIVCDRKYLKGGSYSGVPKFIVETLSPSTAMRDTTIKKDIYEQVGVSEYWIVSCKECMVEIYYLIDGKYQLQDKLILEADIGSPHYNAEVKIILRDFPNISMTLAEIFEGLFEEEYVE
ncbi:MAG: Uma2 family endonuclease [Lachnospiraceae bacterium]|nr:Uma2 family endonuclease [Lachnospiraceae bacterium]